MIVIYGYLERESDKVFKFHMNSSSFFEVSVAPPSFKCYPLRMQPLKASRLNKRRGVRGMGGGGGGVGRGGTYERKYGIYK